MVRKILLSVFIVLLLVGVASAWSVSITEPTNTTYEEVVNSFDVTYDIENASSCLYNLNGTNRTFTCGESSVSTINSSEGQNELIVYVSNGTTNESDSVNFWIDSIKPNLTYVTPASELIFTTGDTFNFQFWLNETNRQSYDEDNFAPFWLKVTKPNSLVGPFESPTLINQSSDDETFSEVKNISPSAGDLKEGNYTWIAFSKDIFPNGTTIREVNLTGTIIRDLTPPFNSTPSQTSDVYGEGKLYNFNITWEDATSWINDSSVLFSFEGNDKQGFPEGNGVYSSNITDWKVGSYNYSWSASDMAGNGETTGNLIFTIIQATPELGIIGDTPIMYPEESNFTGINCPEDLSCSMNLANGTYGVGNYTFNYSTSGDHNYTGNWTTKVLTVIPNDSPCDVLFNTSSPVTYPNSFTVYSNCNSNFTLYRNGTIIDNNSEQILGAGVYNFTVIRDDSQNYSNVYDEENFAVERANPETGMIINNNSVVYGNSANVSANETNNNDTGCNYTLYSKGNLIANNWDNIVYGEGTINYVYNTSGCQNYTAGSVTGYLEVSKANSSVNLSLNGAHSNISVGYQEPFLIEGNVTTGNDNGTIRLFIEGGEITYPNINLSEDGKYLNKTDWEFEGVYNITVSYSSQNYTSSIDTLFVTVNEQTRSSSGGSDCKTVWNCTEWSEWSACIDGLQNRTCLDRERVSCRKGNTSKELDAGETRDCTTYTITEVPPTSIPEGEPIVYEEPEEDTRGLFARITGGAIGFARSGSGILTIVTILVLAGVYGAVHYKRKYS